MLSFFNILITKSTNITMFCSIDSPFAIGSKSEREKRWFTNDEKRWRRSMRKREKKELEETSRTFLDDVNKCRNASRSEESVQNFIPSTTMQKKELKDLDVRQQSQWWWSTSFLSTIDNEKDKRTSQSHRQKSMNNCWLGKSIWVDLVVWHTININKIKYNLRCDSSLVSRCRTNQRTIRILYDIYF